MRGVRLFRGRLRLSDGGGVTLPDGGGVTLSEGRGNLSKRALSAERCGGECHRCAVALLTALLMGWGGGRAC